MWLDLVSKSSKQKLSFNLIHYFLTCCATCWIEYSICVLPRQRCACASFFSNHILFVFYSPNYSNSFLVFCEYHERETPLMQKRLATWKHKHVCFDLLVYLLQKLFKNWKIRMLDGKLIMKKWRFLKARNEGEDQKSWIKRLK